MDVAEWLPMVQESLGPFASTKTRSINLKNYEKCVKDKLLHLVLRVYFII